MEESIHNPQNSTNSKGVIIGLDEKTKAPVFIDGNARARSTYVIGITGTGKSTLLEQMAYQDVANGDGLLFLDPHGDSAGNLLSLMPAHRVKDAVLWDPLDLDHPFGLNPFFISNPHDRLAVTRRADNFVAALASLTEFAPIFETAPQMKNVLHNLAIAFVANPGHSLLETPRFLTDEQFRQNFYPALSDRYKGVLDYWQRFDQRNKASRQDEVRSTLNKLERFPTNPVIEEIFSRQTSVDFRKAMDEGQIIIVKLSGSGIEDTAAFVGAFIIWEVLEAARSRTDSRVEDRRPFHIFADEFQAYMTTAFPVILEQARKYGLDVTIAHQIREQLDENIRARVHGAGNIIVFRVTAPNALALANEFKIDIPEPEITRQEPKYELAANILQHLEQKGVGDTVVMQRYRRLWWALDHFYEKVYEQVREIEVLFQHYNSDRFATPKVPPFDTRTAEARRRDLEGNIDAVLYRNMKDSSWIDRGQETVKLADAPWGYDQNWGFGPFDDTFFKSIQYILFDFSFALQHTEDVVSHARRLKTADPTLHASLLTLYPELDRLPYHWDYEYFFSIEEMLKTWKDSKFLNAAKRAYVRASCIKRQGEVGKDFNEKIWKSVIQDTFDIYVKDINKLASKFEYAFEKKEWRLAYDLAVLKHTICRATYSLSAALFANPIKVPIGQLETIRDKPRLFSDVTAEMASKLGNLDQYHAWCKIQTREAIGNFEIMTTQINQLPNSEVADEIKRRSQEMYGRGPAMASFAKTEASEQAKDDQPIRFGEKNAATTSEMSTTE